MSFLLHFCRYPWRWQHSALWEYQWTQVACWICWKWIWKNIEEIEMDWKEISCTSPKA